MATIPQVGGVKNFGSRHRRQLRAFCAPDSAGSFATLSRADHIRQRGRELYSFYAPEVECFGKGKARVQSKPC
jgi:hypothetical protein